MQRGFFFVDKKFKKGLGSCHFCKKIKNYDCALEKKYYQEVLSCNPKIKSKTYYFIIEIALKMVSITTENNNKGYCMWQK